MSNPRKYGGTDADIVDATSYSWPMTSTPSFSRAEAQGIPSQVFVIKLPHFIAWLLAFPHSLRISSSTLATKPYVDTFRARYVQLKEKEIRYGGKWQDVEVDEVDLDAGKLTDNTTPSTKNTVWEQWGGLVERGRPFSLKLFRLHPAKTVKRAPGPGALRKVEWKPIATKHLANRKVVLHSNGARAYKLKVPGVMHCNVVHKTKVKVNGKAGRYAIL